MEYVHYVRWDTFWEMAKNLNYKFGLAIILITFLTIFAFWLTNWVNNLAERVKYLEGVNEDKDDLRKSSLEEVKNDLHQVTTNQKALTDSEEGE